MLHFFSSLKSNIQKLYIMKKKNLKNLSLNKNSISNLQTAKSIGGNNENSIIVCIRTIVDLNGVNLCLKTRIRCERTWKPGCVITNEVDTNTLPIC